MSFASPPTPTPTPTLAERQAFIAAHTVVDHPPLVPEIALHLATEVTPLWQATEDWLARTNLPPPFWAFAWAGGQALARHLLDHPDLVRGRRVLAFATGGGIEAIAAARAGAARADANEIDPFALAAIGLNAALNRVAATAPPLAEDVVGRLDGPWEVVVAGDVCYERPMAERVTAWLSALAARGVLVLSADPGRAYLPRHGLEALAIHPVPTSLELEDRTERLTTVYRWTGSAAA